ncbi:hypothetical protein EJB05_03343, partial [Eragrostis curvula]
MPTPNNIQTAELFSSNSNSQFHGSIPTSKRGIRIINVQKKPGIEAEFTGLDLKSFFKMALTAKTTGSSAMSLRKMRASNKEIKLPSWLTEEDISYLASVYEKTGFAGGINYYRCLDLNWELMAPWTGAQVKVPTKFIVGDGDLAYHHPGVQNYIHKGGMKRDVPMLEEVVILGVVWVGIACILVKYVEVCP